MKCIALALAAISALLFALVAPADATPATWVGAEYVPNLSTIDLGHYSAIDTVDCTPGGGSCAFAGDYLPAQGIQNPFATAFTNGAFFPGPIRFPDAAGLGSATTSSINSISCWPNGQCGVVGTFSNVAPGSASVFVIGGTAPGMAGAIEVPGLAALATGNYASATKISCVAQSRCTALGIYRDTFGNPNAFVTNLDNGSWSNAAQLPSSSSASAPSDLSCATPDDCVAVGATLNSAVLWQQIAGVWQTSAVIPGLSALAGQNTTLADKVSCVPNGTCTLMGRIAGNTYRIFTSTRTNGVWSNAIELPGVQAFGVASLVHGLSCYGTGDCVTTSLAGTTAFYAERTGGTWSTAQPVEGIASLGDGNNSEAFDVSCDDTGMCVIVGNFQDGNDLVGFASFRTGGVWQSAVEIPGLRALATGGNAYPESVSCEVGTCAIGGQVITSSQFAAFVAMVTPGLPDPTPTTTVPSGGGDPVVPAFTG